MGVAEFGDCGMQGLRSLGVKVYVCVWGLHFGGCSVRGLRRLGLALCRSCSVYRSNYPKSCFFSFVFLQI